MAGHDLRLNNRTEKTTPKPRPRVDFIRRLERHRSHCVSVNWLSTCVSQSFRGPHDSVYANINFGADGHTFSFKSASLTGRETVLGGGGETDVSAILDKERGAATIIVMHQHQSG